ncbi:hypothetical protein [Nocardiopsis chromatogenes]|uniref:hypothetical protein n=1 Tax=Nocardiopsis chromatogenes TaxID=280239 RepID=UPI000348FB24
MSVGAAARAHHCSVSWAPSSASTSSHPFTWGWRLRAFHVRGKGWASSTSTCSPSWVGMSAGTPSFHTHEPSSATRFHQLLTGPAAGSGSASRKAAVQRSSGRCPASPWPCSPTSASASRVCSWKLSPMPSKNTRKPRPEARSRTSAEVAPVMRSRARISANSSRGARSWLEMAISSAPRAVSPRTAARTRWSASMVAAARAWRRMVHQQMVAVAAVSPSSSATVCSAWAVTSSGSGTSPAPAAFQACRKTAAPWPMVRSRRTTVVPVSPGMAPDSTSAPATTHRSAVIPGPVWPPDSRVPRASSASSRSSAGTWWARL